jgi:hypothetical protein
MKAVVIAKVVFVTMGIGLLIGTLPLYMNTRALLDAASKAEGTVVKIVTNRSPGSRDLSSTPLVHFVDQYGHTIEFKSNVGNGGEFLVGEKVEVLYDPTDPQHARINSFFQIWAGSLMMGGLGGGFFLIGAGFIFADLLRSRKDKYLRMHGTPIETKYQRVELNTTLSINGKHPFRVLSQWQNPSTLEMHIFKSNNLWFDPSGYIPNKKKITVFIVKNNLKKYHVDLSFLSKFAK